MQNWASNSTIVIVLLFAACYGTYFGDDVSSAHNPRKICHGETQASASTAGPSCLERQVSVAQLPCHQAVERSECMARHSFELAAGSIIVFGSLDQSAGRHSVDLLWQPSTSDRPIPCSLNGCCRVSGNSPDIWDVAILPQCTVGCCNSSSAPIQLDHLDSGEGISGVAMPTSNESVGTSRRFSIPCFTQCGARSHHKIAKLVASGSRTRVYVADDTQLSSHVCNVANRIANVLDGELRDFVESHLGAVHDIDDDQHLTVLFGSLSTDERRCCESHPINGCVRADDFLDVDAEFGGDIIYIDTQVPTGRDLMAILTHELAHAAIFSTLRSKAIEGELSLDFAGATLPCWLNESIAHYLEQLVCPDSGNLERRVARFCDAPNLFPLVIPDDLPQNNVFRGPTRAAGCLFLQSVMDGLQPGDIGTMIGHPHGWHGAVRQLTGVPFSELFRNWTVQMAQGNQVGTHHLTSFCASSIELSGTSFVCHTVGDVGGVLTVDCLSDCQLQVTILKPKSPQLQISDSSASVGSKMR